MTDRYEPLDGADLWFFDIMKVAEPPGFFLIEEVDMRATREIMVRMRQLGIKGTYTHVITRAVALAFARHPELNRLVMGKRLVYPDSVDLGLSVSSDFALSGDPTMIVQNAEKKDLLQISAEIIQQAAEIRENFKSDLEKTRRIVRVIPFSFLRRWLIRKMKTRMTMIRQKIGVFHITSVPQLRYAIPFIYPGIGSLVITRVENGVVVREGQPVVRPITRLGLVGDHRVWKGSAVSTLINEIKKILEEGELMGELAADEMSMHNSITRPNC